MKKILSLLLATVILVCATAVVPVNAVTIDSAGAGTGDVIAPSDHTDPDDPYIATDFAKLQKFFNAERSGGTVYIKLGKDISFRDYAESPKGLTTNGADVVLDLCGYTLSYTAMKTFAIYGENGKITINDSQRYDSSKKEWISGRVEYEYRKLDDWIVVFSATTLLRGDITVNGGTFVNLNSLTNNSKDSVYSGGQLKMYGGVFEAEYPVRFTKGSAGSGIFGGTLRAKSSNNAAIEVDLSEEADPTPVTLPTITKCEIVNATGNEQAVAFDVKLPDDFSENHTSSDAWAIWNKLVSPQTYAFINGVKQAQGSHGVAYNTFSILGPSFKSSYVLTQLETIDYVKVRIAEPEPGAQVTYYANTPSGSPYSVADYNGGSSAWKNGVMWGYYYHTGDTLALGFDSSTNATLTPGRKYGVWVRVKLNDKYSHQFADASKMTANINDHEAKVYANDDGTVTVYYTFIFSNEVKDVKLTIPRPKAGNTIPYSASVPSNVNYEVSDYTAGTYKNGILWYRSGNMLSPSDTNTFENSKTYTVYILVKPAEYYQLADADSITATVNGRAADEVLNYGSYGYCVKYTFDLSNDISSVSVTIPEPVAGAKMEWKASVPDDEDYTLSDSSSFGANGVTWYIGTKTVTPGKSVTFEEGETYKAVISLDAKEGYYFAASINAKVNGHSVEVGFGSSDTKRTLTYTFVCKAPVKYDLWIGSTQVTEYNKDDILGDGKASFDPETNTLTLDDPDIDTEAIDSDGDTCKIYAADFDLTVKGTLIYNSYDTDSGIWVKGGSLTLDGTFMFLGQEFFAIGAKGDITLSGEIYAYSKDNAAIRSTYGSIIVSDNAREVFAFVNSASDVPAVYARKDIIIADDLMITTPLGGVIKEYKLGKAIFEADGEDAADIVEIMTKEEYELTKPTEPKPTQPTESHVTILLGDADDSGKVNVFDAAYIQKAINGTKGYPDYKSMNKNAPAFRTVDVDNNGAVNIFDASIVLKYTTGDKTVAKYGVGTEIEI